MCVFFYIHQGSTLTRGWPGSYPQEPSGSQIPAHRPGTGYATQELEEL